MPPAPSALDAGWKKHEIWKGDSCATAVAADANGDRRPDVMFSAAGEDWLALAPDWKLVELYSGEDPDPRLHPHARRLMSITTGTRISWAGRAWSIGWKTRAVPRRPKGSGRFTSPKIRSPASIVCCAVMSMATAPTTSSPTSSIRAARSRTPSCGWKRRKRLASPGRGTFSRREMPGRQSLHGARRPRRRRRSGHCLRRQRQAIPAWQLVCLVGKHRKEPWRKHILSGRTDRSHLHCPGAISTRTAIRI